MVDGKGTGGWGKIVSVLIGATLLLGLLLDGTASAAVLTTLPVQTSEGETEPPPATTEIPECTAHGETADPQITEIEGGGRKYSYALPGPSDEYMTTNEPPKGFDPLKASDEELQTWGFPPRPANASGREEWRELVGSYEKPFVGPGCESQATTHPTQGTQHNELWSGYEVENPGQTNVWRAIIGTFYQPYDHGSCSFNAAETSWVGIGGQFSPRFIQTGTEVNIYGLIHPWIEIWSGYESHFAYGIPNFPIQAQAYIRLYAGYNPALQIAYFYITNDSTGQTILNEWHIGTQYYDGSSAEWVDEAPAQGESILPLLNFGQITWWANTAQTYQNYVYPIETVNNYRLTLWREGHALARPEPLWNQSNFSDYYYSCH